MPSRPQSQPTPPRLERPMSARGSGAGKERAGDERRRMALVVMRRRVGRCIVGFSGRVVGWIFVWLGWWVVGGDDRWIFQDGVRAKEEESAGCYIHNPGLSTAGTYVRITPRTLLHL